MKRKSKGQQVKTFKAFVPQEDATYVEEVTKVYFDAIAGEFVIYLPEHMHKVVETLPLFMHPSAHNAVRLDHRRDRLTGKVVDNVISAYKTMLIEYFNLLTDLSAVKVIQVFFQANLPWRPELQAAEDYVFRNGGGSAVTRSDISFASEPTVHLSYRVCWRSGDKLYRKVRHEEWNGRPAYDTMQYIEDPFLRTNVTSRAKIENTILPWTEEKEAFFSNAVEQLTKLGFLLHDFFKDTETNVQFALAQGGTLVLPPPKEQTNG